MTPLIKANKKLVWILGQEADYASIHFNVGHDVYKALRSLPEAWVLKR